MRGFSRCLHVILVAAPLASSAAAVDHLVSTTQQFADALAAAQPGDSILLAPGEYAGGHYRSGLSGVTIRSQDPIDRAIITGGINGIQLSDASSVTLQDLIFKQQTGNGINIDDGGSFATPSTDITIRNVTVRDMAATGNNDGIKLSGVTGFLIDRVTVKNWGAGGSAVDPVGCHHGLIQNSHFTSSVAAGGSGVRPKGGSKGITIRANLIQLPQDAGRGVQAGGSTGSQFFRFVDGDSGYEAADIIVEGNLIEGGSNAISWVNINGGVFHHNYLRDSGDWAFRLLNENVGAAIVQTQNGIMADNIVDYRGDAWRRAGNYDGPGVLEETFTFARNQWFNRDDQTPEGSTPQLPTSEQNGVYGLPPEGGYHSIAKWQFGWGVWATNVSLFEGNSASIEGSENLLLAKLAGEGSFRPLNADPLSGDWVFSPAPAEISPEQFEQTILIRPDASALIPSTPGDYDRSGEVDHLDYELWRSQYGATGPALADGNGDLRVDAADYAVWRNALASNSGGSYPVPSPHAVWGFTLPLAGLIACRKFYALLR